MGCFAERFCADARGDHHADEKAPVHGSAYHLVLAFVSLRAGVFGDRKGMKGGR